MVGSEPGLLRYFEVLTRRPWASITYYDGTKTKQVVRRFTSPNGITGTDDILYVSSTTDRELYKYQIKDNGGLRQIDKINLGAMADNLCVDQENNIYVAGHPKGLTFLKEMEKNDPKSPSIVEKISLNSPSELNDEGRLNAGGKIADAFLGKKYKVETVYADDGSILTAISIALVDSELKVSVLSGIVTKGVLFCSKQL